ncbi:MAG: flagellar biosynthesis protein FlgC [Desulfobulbaceae bacterium]|nr:flagellar biosynthesis protein FlgC [Desulfobulbaceae bacterium]
MINGINASISGLLSLQKKNESIADNTANVDTNGFKKTRVTLQEETPQGVSTHVSRINTPGPLVHEQTPEGEVLVEKSNVEISEELPQQMLTRRFFQANIRTIQTYDEMLGNLLDIKS